MADPVTTAATTAATAVTSAATTVATAATTAAATDITSSPWKSVFISAGVGFVFGIGVAVVVLNYLHL